MTSIGYVGSAVPIIAAAVGATERPTRDPVLLAGPMAMILNNNHVDLGDHRAAFDTLTPLFGRDNVLAVMDVAIEKARLMRAEADIGQSRFG